MTLFVVPGERHVERLARGDKRGETRASVRERLSAALMPEVRFADECETRLTMAIALEDARARAKQLDLFGAPAGMVDPLLATLRGRGGASWVRAVAAIDDAVGSLRARGVTADVLDRVVSEARGGGGKKRTGVAGARARTLAAAMRALDETLAKRGGRDSRLRGALLAAAIRGADPEELAGIIGTRFLRARWILDWEPSELAWWRALDERLIVLNGEARIMLPSFDQKLSASRERDPLELLADVIARHLDAAPETETIKAVLGDLASVPPEPELVQTARVVRAASARTQARIVAQLVGDALAGGRAVERIAIAYPSRDEKTLLPLRRALEAEGIVFHDARGAPPSTVPVVAAALHALEAAESLDRAAVARLLRSGYLDAPRMLGDAALSFRDAERILERLARGLETRATRTGADPAERLLRTAATAPEDEPHAQRVVEVLVRGRTATTREERVRAARVLFDELGLGTRAGRGALATFSRDEAPRGVDRAERLAVARDVRAWERTTAALELYETTVADGTTPVDAEVFRLELAELLDRATPQPGAGRAGAVRIVRLGEVAGERLELLIVLDANDGVLPRDTAPITLVSESLEAGIVRASRDERAARTPGELGARDLAALAMAAADAEECVLVTTAEDTTDAPAQPARVALAVLRARPDEPFELRPIHALEDAVLRTSVEVARRVARERTREGFFLDPARPLSDVVGALAPSPALIAVITHETGPTLERALAVTSIERFAQCAFKGFAHVVLSAREGEEQNELPDAREEGNLGHAALAAAFVAVGELWTVRPRAAEEIERIGLVAAVAALAASEGHAPLRAIVRLRIRESVRALLKRATEDEDWDFHAAEQMFGRKGASWPAYGIEANGDAIWLRGSIDRVDRAHGRASARVVDYKRSKSTVRASSGTLGETALQIPVYAAVAARHLEMPATGTYLPMQPRDLAQETRANGKAEERVLELAKRPGRGLLAPIETRVLDLARSVRAGNLAPLPAKESECTYCSVSGGCRKPRFAMAPDEDEEQE